VFFFLYMMHVEVVENGLFLLQAYGGEIFLLLSLSLTNTHTKDTGNK
jgi:hypothetical protein